MKTLEQKINKVLQRSKIINKCIECDIDKWTIKDYQDLIYHKHSIYLTPNDLTSTSSKSMKDLVKYNRPYYIRHYIYSIIKTIIKMAAQEDDIIRLTSQSEFLRNLHNIEFVGGTLYEKALLKRVHRKLVKGTRFESPPDKLDGYFFIC